jgi:hypothetical protein
LWEGTLWEGNLWEAAMRATVAWVAGMAASHRKIKCDQRGPDRNHVARLAGETHDFARDGR